MNDLPDLATQVRCVGALASAATGRLQSMRPQAGQPAAHRPWR